MTRPELDFVFCRMRDRLVGLAKRRMRADLAEEAVQQTYLLLVQNEVYKKWPRSRIEAERRIGYKVRTQLQRTRRTESRYELYEGDDDGRAGSEHDAGFDGRIADGSVE